MSDVPRVARPLRAPSFRPRPEVSDETDDGTCAEDGEVPSAATGVRPASVPEPPISVEPTASARRSHTAGADIDWSLVRAFRQAAADRLTAQLREREGLDEAGRRELGRAVIAQVLRDHTSSQLTSGTAVLSPARERELQTAIFDALFGLGRLQGLVDDPDIENIEILGHDHVMAVYSDGRVERAAPVADSDEELIETLAFLATRTGSSERSFTSANPRLHMTLHGGARLAASAWTTPRPTVTIRRHRLTDIDLTSLVELGMMDLRLAGFLAASVRARKSIVVSGAQGAGKTTLVRALANEIDPDERIGTIETEYELHLHELHHRHRRGVVAMQARPGTGERMADGRSAGEVTLDDLIYDSLRHNLSRIIVGEVRGKEVIPMFKAMQAGSGSLSTTHAHSGRAVIERLVTCALEAGPHVTEDFAYRQVAEHIDLIVQITVAQDAGRPFRYVSEVLQVTPGERGRPSILTCFGADDEGRIAPRTHPTFLPDLAAVGFDPAWLTPVPAWPEHPGREGWR